MQDSLVAAYYLPNLNSCLFWMLTSSQPFPTVCQAISIYGVVLFCWFSFLFLFFPESVIYLNRYIMACTVCGLSSHLRKWVSVPKKPRKQIDVLYLCETVFFHLTNRAALEACAVAAIPCFDPLLNMEQSTAVTMLLWFFLWMNLKRELMILF